MEMMHQHIFISVCVCFFLLKINQQPSSYLRLSECKKKKLDLSNKNQNMFNCSSKHDQDQNNNWTEV